MIFFINKNSNWIPVLTIAIVLFFVLIPQNQAKAGWCDGIISVTTPCLILNGGSAAASTLSTAAAAVFDLQGTLFNFASTFLLQLAGNFLAWAASILDSMVTLTNFFPDVVQLMWSIFRNFANLFFILILIVVAFATIFDNQKYNYREILPRLIIAALLINFSYVIGTTIVGVADTVGHAMLGQITTLCPSVTSCLMNGTGVQGITALQGDGLALSAATAASAGAGTLMTLLFLIALIIVLAIVFFTAGLLLVARMFALWFLLIFSPLAWLASILPNTRKWSSQWWQEFMGWAFFPVIYFFFLAMGMGFINAKSQIAVIGVGANSSKGNIFSGVLGLNELIFYLITLVIVGGGLFFSKKIGSVFGVSVVSTAGRIQGGVQNYSRRFGGAAYQYSGARNRVEGAREGLAARGEQIKEKGLFGIGGAQKGRMTKAGYAEKFGGNAARGALDKQITSEVAKAKGQYATIKSEDELRARMNQTSNDIDKLALAERLKEEGSISSKEALDTYKNYQRVGAELAAQQFAKGIDFGKDKMTTDERAAWELSTNDPIIKRKIEMAKADSTDYRNASAEELVQAATIFGNNKAEQKIFLDKIAKINFMAATQAKADIESIGKSADERQAVRDESLAKALSGMNLDKILEMTPNSLEAVLKNENARRSIENKLTPETIKMITSKASAAQLDVLDKVIETKKIALEEDENKKLQKQADAQAKGMQPFVDAIQNLANKQEPPPTNPPDNTPPPPKPWETVT